MKELRQKIFRTVKDPPILRVVSPLQKFIKQEAASGKILLACIVVGIIWANIPFGDSYNYFWNIELSISLSFLTIAQPLIHWINDGLMAIFFFVIGLELKREILIGGLSNLKDASLSIFTAIGGMVFPAIIFISINPPKTIGAKGWGIPMATDIAIALGILSFFSYRIPKRIKLFLTSMAIIDDLGAILVVAIFYSHSMNWLFFGLALGIIGILILFNRLGFRNILMYVIPGIFLWLFMLKSGIHATIAGVVLAATIPATKRIDLCDFYDMSKKSLRDISDLELDPDEVSCYTRVISQVHALEEGFRNIQAPLSIIEHKLIGWVAFFIVPLFAISNAGINFGALTTNPLTERVFWGIFLGLIIGKPLGILLVIWITKKLKFFEMPSNINWFHLVGMANLMGIGFTMASFMAGLSFSENNVLLTTAKIAILIASIISGLVGFVFLRLAIKKFIPIAKNES
ncbi:MAG: Na+/H+ antiporter NhaA [Candidatus Heimdallarchaeota archaeon]|nr:Na+/H+ antiporter NhaA [Candidatus Heimdallarchaeota archaeon]